MMHICFLSREYPPNSMGGIGTYVVNMADVLLDAGHNVTVITKWHPDAGNSVGFEQIESHRDGRLQLIYLPFTDEEWNLDTRCSSAETDALAQHDIAAVFAYSLAKGLLTFVETSDIDLIEAPEYEYPAYYYQILRHAQDLPPDARSRHVPVVIHLHSPSLSIFRENDDLIDSPWQRFRAEYEKASIRYADAVLSPSSYLANEVAEWAGIPRDTIQVIPYPLGNPLACDDTPAVEETRFLFVGRVEPRKGAFEYVEAAVQHARKHPTAEFHFIGGPHVRNEAGDGRTTQEVVEAFIPNALRPQFRFMAKVPRERLAAEYASAGFCVVPSRWDNYPNTCMEPMSLGRPVLVSDRGGQAELVEDGSSGWIAKGGTTPGELARALEETMEKAHAMSAQARLEMGQAARQRVRKVCENQTVLEAHLDFYQQVCKAHNEPLSASHPQKLIACLFSPKESHTALTRTLASLSDSPVTQVLIATSAPLPGYGAENIQTLSLTSENRLPHSGIRKGWWTQILEQEIRTSQNAYVLFTAPGRKISNAFLSTAMRVMNAQPQIAFCTGWIGNSMTHLQWAGGEADVNLLQDRREFFPACGIFRWSAVLEAGGLEGEALIFSDVIRNLQRRLTNEGYSCMSLPMCALDQAADLTYPTLEHYGFYPDAAPAKETQMGHTATLHGMCTSAVRKAKLLWSDLKQSLSTLTN